MKSFIRNSTLLLMLTTTLSFNFLDNAHSLPSKEKPFQIARTTCSEIKHNIKFFTRNRQKLEKQALSQSVSENTEDLLNEIYDVQMQVILALKSYIAKCK